MKRIFIILLSIFIILSSFSGCGTSLESGAGRHATEFLKVMYAFDKVDKIIDFETNTLVDIDFCKTLQPYMTEKGFHTIINSREALSTVQAAFENDCNINTEKIKLEISSVSREDSTVCFNFTADINMTPLKGGSTKKLQVLGQINVVKDGKEYKVLNISTYGSKDWIEAQKYKKGMNKS